MCKDENALEIMRISTKKEADRKDKLEKLLMKYDQIHSIERQHVKTLKAGIIVLSWLSLGIEGRHGCTQDPLLGRPEHPRQQQPEHRDTRVPLHAT